MERTGGKREVNRRKERKEQTERALDERVEKVRRKERGEKNERETRTDGKIIKKEREEKVRGN